VVVDMRIADRYEVGGVGEIDETIVEVLAMVFVGGNINVVDPDV